MFKNYLKIVARNLVRHKTYSLINIFGLAVGLAVFILAALYVDFHFGFDRFHKDGDRIYTVFSATPSGNVGERHGAWMPIPLLPLLNREFPEIEDAVRLISLDRPVLRYGDKKFQENAVRLVDKNFFSFFSFQMTAGKPGTALASPNSVVITESTARKYFGGADPMGKVLQLDYYSYRDIKLKVTGVTKDVPADSSIRYDFLISISGAFTFVKNWDTAATAFLRLKKGTDPHQLEAKFPSFVEKHFPRLADRRGRLYLFALTDIHLGTVNILSPYRSMPVAPFYMVLAVAVILLLVVCINLMNLFTSRYMTRAKEVGIRKAVGAHRYQLVKQFLGESVFLTFVALPLGMVFYEIMRPGFLALLGSEMDISLWRSPMVLAGLLGVTLVVGITAGSYPAFFLSAFKPIFALKKTLNIGTKGSRARKILVVTQFAMSVILIVFSLVIVRQFNLLLRTDLGFDRENIVTLPFHREMRKSIEPMKEALLKHPEIVSVSASTWLPYDWHVPVNVQPEGVSEEDARTMSGYPVGYDYIETIGMKIIEGRSYSRQFNDRDTFIVSQSAARQLEWDKPVGKSLMVNGRKGVVIGVAADFHFNHLFFKKVPSLLYFMPNWCNWMLIKVSSPPGAGVKDYIEKQWDKFAGGFPFEFSMLAHRFEENFRETTRTAEIFKFVSFVSIFIACLGLFGLASHTVVRRTKEIGIRKTLGASAPNVVQMLIREFVKLVAIANIIALPAAYFLMEWFLDWAWVDRINLGAAIFVSAALVSLLSALVSVILQTLKAALANPVEALRYE